jgi:hypothetical protein
MGRTQVVTEAANARNDATIENQKGMNDADNATQIALEVIKNRGNGSGTGSGTITLKPTPTTSVEESLTTDKSPTFQIVESMDFPGRGETEDANKNAFKQAVINGANAIGGSVNIDHLAEAQIALSMWGNDATFDDDGSSQALEKMKSHIDEDNPLYQSFNKMYEMQKGMSNKDDKAKLVGVWVSQIASIVVPRVNNATATVVEKTFPTNNEGTIADAMKLKSMGGD